MTSWPMRGICMKPKPAQGLAMRIQREDLSLRWLRRSQWKWTRTRP